MLFSNLRQSIDRRKLVPIVPAIRHQMLAVMRPERVQHRCDTTDVVIGGTYKLSHPHLPLRTTKKGHHRSRSIVLRARTQRVAYRKKTFHRILSKESEPWYTCRHLGQAAIGLTPLTRQVLQIYRRVEIIVKSGPK